MHEILHLLGFYHEHQHPDRDLIIFWESVHQSQWNNYNLDKSDVEYTNYDEYSIMHYPPQSNFCIPKYCVGNIKTNCYAKGTRFCNFNEDPRQIRCVRPTHSRKFCDERRTRNLGQRRFLSDGDMAKLMKMYQRPAWPVGATRLNTPQRRGFTV